MDEWNQEDDQEHKTYITLDCWYVCFLEAKSKRSLFVLNATPIYVHFKIASYNIFQRKQNKSIFMILWIQTVIFFKIVIVLLINQCKNSSYCLHLFILRSQKSDNTMPTRLLYKEPKSKIICFEMRVRFFFNGKVCLKNININQNKYWNSN